MFVHTVGSEHSELNISKLLILWIIQNINLKKEKIIFLLFFKPEK